MDEYLIIIKVHHPTCGIESNPSALSFSFIIATLACVDFDLAPRITTNTKTHTCTQLHEADLLYEHFSLVNFG